MTDDEEEVFLNPEKVDWRVFMFQLDKNNVKLLFTKIKILK